MYRFCIEIKVEINELHSVDYRYYFTDMVLYLDSMIVLKRESKRHKLKVILKESYHRIDGRNYGIKNEPEVDMEIQLEALKQFRNKIEVKKWDR